MAINFLNTVNFNKNQLNFARIQNLGTDPSAANSSIGQIYFNTTLDTLKQYVANDGSGNPGWVEVGATSGVETITSGDGTASLGEAITVNTSAIGDVTLDVFEYDGGAKVGYVPKDGLVNQYLDGTGAWVDVTTGDIESVNAATAANLLGINITTPLGPNPTVGLDIVGRDSLGGAPDTGDQLLIYDLDVTKNKKVTVGNLVGGFETTYTIDVPTGTTNVNLQGSDSTGVITDDPITISGTTNQIAITRIDDSELRVSLTPDVTIEDDLTVGGIITQTQTGGSSTTGVNNGAVSNSDALVLTADNTAIVVGMVLSGTGIVENITIATVTDAKTFVLSSATNIANTTTITFSETNSFATQLDMNNNRIAEVKTGIVGTDAVNLAQVNSLIAGNGSFKGAYNATNDPGSPIISTNNNVALSKGDYFVVTSGGVITFSDKAVTVEVGDFIFAEDAIAAGGGVGAGTASTEYIIVIADANLATAGTLTGAQRGVAGFDEDIFTVTTTSPTAGFVSLNKQTNPYGISVLLEDGVDNAGGTETTFTVDIATVARFGTGAKAKNCKAEVITEAGRLTSYPEVTGNGVGSMIFKFKPTVADGVEDTSGYRALISIV